MKKDTTIRILKSVMAIILAITMVVTGIPSTMLGWFGIADETDNDIVLAATSWKKESIPTTGGSTLKDGYIYTVTANTTVTAGSTKNGLTVANNATVIIYIQKGKTLTVKGGAGSGRSGGGAGIYVPYNATLIVTGQGTLKAYGGKAGSGTKAAQGGSGTISISKRYAAGSGSAGGAGGGGAGAGIGGSGGYGGSGGAGGTGASSTSGSTGASGYNGSDGGNGSLGVSAGKIYLVGNVYVYAYGGGQGDGAGSSSAGSRAYDGSSKWDGKKSHVAGPGGAGGSGGGGASANATGGGAGGGAGGGGGGGGAIDYRGDSTDIKGSSWNSNNSCGGAGGYGGSYGGKNGEGTRDTGKDGGNWERYGGYGGYSGNVGSVGSSNYRYKTSTSGINSTSGFSTIATSKLPTELKYTITYINEKTDEAKTEDKTVYIGYETQCPSADMMPNDFKGYEFYGFYTSPNGAGTRVIDENGNVIAGTTYTDGTIWLSPENLTLYAYYKPKTYTHNLNSSEATESGDATVETTYDTAVPSTNVQIPLKTNSVFLGYFTGENGTGTKLIDATGAFIKDSTVSEYIDSDGQWIYDGDLTLYANWLTIAGTAVTSEILTISAADEIAKQYYYGKISVLKDEKPYDTDRLELKKDDIIYRMTAGGDGTYSIATSTSGTYEILIDGTDTGYSIELNSEDENSPSEKTIYAITASVQVNIDDTAYDNGRVELKDSDGKVRYTTSLEQDGRYTCIGFFDKEKDDTTYDIYVDGKAADRKISFESGKNDKTIDFYSFNVLTMLDDAVATYDNSSLTLKSNDGTIELDPSDTGSYSYLGTDKEASYEICIDGKSTGQNVSASKTTMIKYYTTTINVTKDGVYTDASDIYLYSDEVDTENIENNKIVPVRTDKGIYTIRYAAKDELYHIFVNGQEYSKTINFVQKNVVDAAFTALRVQVNKDGSAIDPQNGVFIKAGSQITQLDKDSTGNYSTYVYSTSKTVYDVITGSDMTGQKVQASSPTCTVDYYTLTLDVTNAVLDDPVSYVQLKGSKLTLSDKVPTCNDADYPEFAGWYQSADGSGDKVTEYTFDKTATLYARFSKGQVPYTVNYYVPDKENDDNEDGYVLAATESGKAEIDKTVGLPDQSADVKVSDPLADGGTLSGYHLLFDHSSVDKTGYIVAKRDSDNIIDMYYKYEQVDLSYDITGYTKENKDLTNALNSAGGTYDYGTVVTLVDPLSYLEDNSYTTSGWKDQNGNYYNCGQKITLTDDLKLTAALDETFTITYQQNGGNVGLVNEPTLKYNEKTGENESAIVYDETTGKYYDSSTNEELKPDTGDQVMAEAKGSSVEIGLDSQRDGMKLAGWWLLDEKGNKTDIFFSATSDDIPTYTLNRNITLKAQWIASVTQPTDKLYTVVPVLGYDPENIEEGNDYKFYIDYVGTSYITDGGYVATSSVENASEDQMTKLTPQKEKINVDGVSKEVPVYTIKNITESQYITVSGVKYKICQEGITVSDIPTQEYEGTQLKPEIKVGSILGDMTEGTDYTLSYGKNEWNGEKNAGSITLTGCGDYADTYTVNFEITDTKAPTVSGEAEGITVATSNWRSFINKISFGLFFKDTKNVTIKASDAGSGIKSIDYILSDKDSAYTLDELENISDNADDASNIYWRQYTGTFQISPDFKGVIYARIMDNAKNTMYINTDGLVFYKDAQFDINKKTFIKDAGQDLFISGSLYKNTIDSISITSLVDDQTESEKFSIHDSYYSVDEKGITINEALMEGYIAGNYRIDITVAPYGLENAQKQVISVPVQIVDKTEVTISGLKAENFTEGENKTGLTGNAVCKVDDNDVTSECGNLIYTYKGTGDTTYEQSQTAPTKKGTYQVTVSVPKDNKYHGSVTYYYEIKEAVVVSGTLTWNYKYDYEDENSSGIFNQSIIAGTNDDEISKTATVQLLNHGKVISQKQISVEAVMEETSKDSETSRYTKAKGTYKFDGLSAYVDGVEASYSIQIKLDKETDYYVMSNGWDADIDYIPHVKNYDVKWNIDIKKIETIEHVIPDTVFVKLLYSNGTNDSETYKPITNMENNNGIACVMNSEKDGSYTASGVYRIPNYLGGAKAKYKVLITGYEVDGRYIDVTEKNYLSDTIENNTEDAVNTELNINSLPVPVLVFDGNSGLSSTEYILKDALGATVTTADLASVIAGKTYYDFTGWYTKADCKKSDKVDSDITIDTCTTLYAGYRDNTPPTGTIQVESRNWKELLNKITFGIFFKESKTVSIHAEDLGSGVKSVSYYLHTDDGSKDYKALTMDDLEKITDSEWTNGTTIDLKPNIDTIVYAKITDNGGNVTYISSDGMIFYTDAQTKTEKITYIKKSMLDVNAEVELNGNSIKEIKNGDTVLNSGTDYQISEDESTIVFKADYLQSLDVGNYTINVSYNLGGETEFDENIDVPSMETTIDLSVEKNSGNITDVSELSKIYDGTAVITPTFNTTNDRGTSDSNVTVEYMKQDETDSTYSSDAPKDAGKYKVRITVAGDDNYNQVAVEKEFIISQKEVTASIKASDKTYDGNVQANIIAAVDTGLNGEALTIDGVTGTFASADVGMGKYVTVDHSNATVTSANDDTIASNYTIKYPEMTSASISAKAVEIEWSDTEFVYDGMPHVPTARAVGLVDKDECVVTVSGSQTDAGNYEAKADALSNSNYILSEDATLTTAYTIYNATQTEPEVTATAETIKGKADGKISGLTTDMQWRKKSINAGVSAETAYQDITDTDMTFAAGTYEIRYATKNNYNPSEPVEVTIDSGKMLDITVPSEQTGYSLFSDANKSEWNGNVKFTFYIMPGYLASEDFAIKINGNIVTFTALDDGTYEYMLTGITEDISIDVYGIVDNTAPTGQISVGEVDKWTDFLNTITFDRFFKETQKVIVSASDEGSGVAEVAYYVYELSGEMKPLNKDDMSGIDADKWIKGKLSDENNIAFSVDPDKKIVIYARLTDKAGNVSYISSDGMVLDATAPLISGIKEGGSYCEDVTINVNETNIDKVTYSVDGNETVLEASVDGGYKLPISQIVPLNGKKDMSVSAFDKAGNETVISIKAEHNYSYVYVVVPTVLDGGWTTHVCRRDDHDCGQTYDDAPTSPLGESGLKSNDKAALKKINEEAKQRIEDGRYSSEKDKEFYQNMADKTQDMLNDIEKANSLKQEIDDYNVPDITKPTSNDSEKLKDALTKIDELLDEENPDTPTSSLTDDQKKALEDLKNDIKSKQDTINMKEAAKSDIDSKANEAKAAIDQMEDLTPEQKSQAKANIDKNVEEAKKAVEDINAPNKDTDADAIKEAINKQKSDVSAVIDKKQEESSATNDTNAKDNAKKAEEAVTKAETVIEDIKISSIDEDTIKEEVISELNKSGVDNADVKVSELNKTSAKLHEKGKITGTVEIKVGSTTKIVEVNQELPELSTFVNYDSKAEEDVPKSNVSVDENLLMDNVLSEDNIDLLDKGSNADILLHIKNKDMETEEAAQDKNLIEEVLADNEQIGKVLDISLLLSITDSDGKKIVENQKISEAKTMFTITVDIPDELVASDNVVRSYQIVRVHDGVAEMLDYEYDEAARTLTFATDRFSTYAITYSDTEKQIDDPSKDKDTDNSGSSDNGDISDTGSANSTNTTNTTNSTNTTSNTIDDGNASGGESTTKSENISNAGNQSVQQQTSSKTAKAGTTKDNTTKKNGTQTSDNNDAVPFVVLLLAGVAVVAASRKKKVNR